MVEQPKEQNFNPLSEDTNPDEKDVLVSLFTDTDYKDVTFEYKDFKQNLFALRASSTDYDLTG